MANPDNLSSESAFIRYWQRIPVLIRAVVSGYFVYAIAGLVAWMTVLAFIPVPWSLVVMWGILAYVSDSLIPAMISHAVADIFNFSYWWTDVAGRFDKQAITETGVDAHFIVWVLILVIATVMFVVAAPKTLTARRSG